MLVSEATLEELDDVLRRPKLARYVGEEQRLEFLTAYIRDAEIVVVTTRLRECRDPTDDKFLELAIEGKATHIISGVQDLLMLSRFRGVASLTPVDFLRECFE